MIKNARKILKYFNNTPSSKGLAPSNIALQLKLDYIEVCNIIDYLCEENLIKPISLNSYNQVYISTSKGRNYFKVSIKSFIINFIYPIIIALISFVLSLLVK